MRIKKIFASPKGENYFFGYYDTPQISSDDTKLLALKVDFIDRYPDKNDVAIVGYFDMNSPQPIFHEIGITRAFNWQQGCMLQFLGPDFANLIIWNDFEDGRYISKIYNFDNDNVRKIPAIYDVAPNGAYALSVNFKRHFWYRRGYSYGNVVDKSLHSKVSPAENIYRIDLVSGKSTTLIKLDDLLKISSLKSMEGATHYLEHVSISPNSKSFVFLHRWRHDNGIHSRLFHWHENKLSILSDTGRVGHYSWLDDDSLILYGGAPTVMNSFRKSNNNLIRKVFKLLLPLYKRVIKDTSTVSKSLTGDSYLVLNTKKVSVTRVLTHLNHQDGHPSKIDSDWIVTDTYARSKISHLPKLITANWRTGKTILIDELKSIDQFDETPFRCDLHPRVSPSKKFISIDTMDQFCRSVYVYKITQG